MQQIVRVESGGNPFAIGVVGGRLVRQPRNISEAVATANALMEQGHNFSIGRGQVNKVHFDRLGWNGDLALGFDVCKNMVAASGIFEDCEDRAKKAGYYNIEFTVENKDSIYSSVHAALSCYYSGSFVRGAQLGYVNKVLAQEAVPVPSNVIPVVMNRAGAGKAKPTEGRAPQVGRVSMMVD